ncbi:Na+/H+ antiporter NhaC family protein [Proteocatella sphenisci]|uniref:Na+/H+ antiporter NhaC family protein n=1 Tax=Proteocatella sphenisci TaxID=181070 RepID=UPI00048E91CB|nr:Na+/H+ antiporter NhaC family protein [Proteocatella sphenisci]
MDIVIGMLFTFSVLIFSVYKGIFVGIPLLTGFFIFAFISWKRGFPVKNILIMSYTGGKDAFVVLKIFVLIGAITSMWMASGTVPAIVYYTLNLMNPNFFILYAFLISAVTSMLLGTSLGTVSTVGLALIIMAKGGNVDLNIATGAIISGAFLGDRSSPMSSSASLVASITGTNLFVNIRNMFSTAIVPFVISIILYTMFSFKQPLNFTGTNIDSNLIDVFNINWMVLLPAVIIIILSILKINVKISMSFSILSAAFISFLIQNNSLIEIIKYLFLGFRLDPSSPLYDIIKGGGIIFMWKAALVVFISCSLAGIFEGTKMLKSAEDILRKAKKRSTVFFYTTIVSIVTAAVGCNQSISIVLTNQLMKKVYTYNSIDNHQLAVDLENTGIILSALIPWNIASLLPTSTLDVSHSGFIPYAFYLYLIPVLNLIYFKIKKI